jgi:hypothetical protein
LPDIVLIRLEITDKRGLRSRGPTPANGGGSTVKR